MTKHIWTKIVETPEKWDGSSKTPKCNHTSITKIYYVQSYYQPYNEITSISN